MSCRSCKDLCKDCSEVTEASRCPRKPTRSTLNLKLNMMNQRKQNKSGKNNKSQVDITKYMSTSRVSGPRNPDSVNKTLMSTVKFEYVPSTTAGLAFTPQDILVNVPGNVPTSTAGTPPIYWKFLRLVKVSVYDMGSGSGSTPPSVAVTFPNEPRNITDLGVQGAESANVHVRPPLSVLSRWFPGTDVTTKVFSASTGSGGNHTIHLTAELLSA